jgi:isoleucyl-tRNA synthetase
MKREADLIDVWFDSGSMPYAQWHYLLKTRTMMRIKIPADLAEGVDQTAAGFILCML